MHRAVFSKNFFIGIVAAIAILFFGSIGMVSKNVTAVIAFEHAYGYNNIIHLLFLADTFAYASSFATEWQNGYFRFNIIRSNTTTYAMSKSVSTAISSGLSVSLGVAVYIIGLCITQPVIMPDSLAIQVEVTTFNDLLEIGNPVLYFLAYLFIIFLQAMFFSVVGLLASGYFPNKYVAYATPFALGYAMNQLANAIGLPNWMDPVKMALARLYSLSAFKVILVETVVFFTLTAICSALFVRIVKRSVSDG